MIKILYCLRLQIAFFDSICFPRLMVFRFSFTDCISECMADFTQLRDFPSDYELSRVMRKPTICICENKDADQLRGMFSLYG